MTFPINTAIPAAGNNPSADQPPMQVNFANIAGFLGVDLTAPGTAGAGQHNQVTFTINQSAPSIASGVSGLYSNSVPGILGTLATLFFQNSSKIFRLSNLALASNTTFTNATGTNWGFTSPWGFIFNFGQLTLSSSPATLTFAVPMTNAQYIALISINSNNPGFPSVATIYNLAATTMQVYSTRTGLVHYYLALGY
jgi:hypothetical protein